MHPYDMPQPTQLVLGDCGLNTLATCSSEDLSVGHSVMPGDSQVALQTADVKVFQGLDVAAVSNPGFTAVEEGGDADRLVDTDFCIEMKVLILKNPPPESSKGS